jgi:radical SAM superfamily enzyme YgiQ (UPF0313 family)
MNILLTLPFDTSYNQDAPDLGLGYLAEALRQEEHNVELLLRSYKYSSAAEFADYIKNSKFDVYCIKVLAPQIKSSIETINIIRSADPKAIIVLGGPHISGDPGRLFDFFENADYGIQGEAENSLVQLIRKLSSKQIQPEELKTIPGLVWKYDSNVVINKGIFCDNLDTIHFPAWDLMKPKDFPGIPFNGYSRRFPIAPMLLTRGCPYRCTFCGAHTVNGYRIRSRSADNILEELQLLTRKYGVKETCLM